jgi:outer membrane protein OmpA-like peptidoglycan-associated protein
MMLRSARLLSLSSLTLCAAMRPAQAQYFTNQDGCAESGAYRVQVELSPSLWLPAADGSFALAHPTGNAIPSLISLASAPHPSFTGGGLLRYGPYSTELDLQYVNSPDNKTLPGAPDSGATQLHLDASYVRIAPGLGYQLYKGNVFSIPASLDARAGIAYFETWQQMQGTGNPNGGASHGGDFAQPWIGTRINFVPANSWRIELAALAQGLGIGNASWGWGASGIVSYAVSDWWAVGVGYKTLSAGHNMGYHGISGAPKRSLDLTAYGPVLGVTFRFGSAPPPPPAPTSATIAAPVPVQARTYLVSFDGNSAALTPRAEQILAQAASDRSNQNMTIIEVNESTDMPGTAPYSMDISLRIAGEVEAQLVADGVPDSEIGVQGPGGTTLREPQNHCVEIILQ